MEKYCPQQGLPEREDIVFVAEALIKSSKSSQVTLSWYVKIHGVWKIHDFQPVSDNISETIEERDTTVVWIEH